MPAGTYDDLQKRIEEWTLEILCDQDKMDAWVEEKKTLNRLNASGLLLDKEIKKISDKVEKEKLLDDLFNPDASMAVTQYRVNKLAGKTATHVWMDDPWDI